MMVMDVKRSHAVQDEVITIVVLRCNAKLSNLYDVRRGPRGRKYIILREGRYEIITNHTRWV